MTPPDASAQAADWHVRLRRSDIDQRSLAEFRAWRGRPENDRAFRELETLWTASASLETDPEIGLALNEAMRGKRRTSPAIWIGGAMAAAAAALVAVLVVQPWATGGDLYATNIGQQSTTHLSDGSILRLDADSRVHIAMRDGRRAVTLDKGQALFDVAHDAARPFVVSAGSVQVTAIGTRFDVRRSGRSDVRVALLQGRVVVRTTSGPQKSWTLGPGQALDMGGRQPAPVPLDADAATAWTLGRLVFHETPVADAVAEANRYSPERLKLAPEGRWKTITVDGVFVAGDADALARALSALYGLTLVRQPDGSILLSPGSNTPAAQPG